MEEGRESRDEQGSGFVLFGLGLGDCKLRSREPELSRSGRVSEVL